MDTSPQRHQALFPAKKDKKDSQRQYRFKESDGFSELRQALQTTRGMTLHGRVTRHQLLTKAAEQLRYLAKENQELLQHMSAEFSARYPVFTGINHLDGAPSPDHELTFDLVNQPYPASNTQPTWPMASCPQGGFYLASDSGSRDGFSNHLIHQY